LNNTDILFASFLGSKIAEKVPRIAALQNKLMKHVLPPIPFLPLQNQESINSVSEGGITSIEQAIKSGSTSSINATINQADPKRSADQQYFPFYFGAPDGSTFLLPYEPIMNIQGKNTIVKRNVAKADGMIGTIKERWNQGDYEITITGVLIGSIETGSVQDCFPIQDFQKLKFFMTAASDLPVFCEPLQLLGINRIVIEEFSFPFTKGENVQAYEIKAYSDSSYDLLIEIDD
jgi:hypothetical protein